ncbi:hypothetical protein PCANC_05568 [Puccinia coronata f. sp. avenae]|uniref:Uncharacterized protein n=1 Tax=Puccinia coronata f. sp. avenae TaxID=200324 RepID=A0A2N5VPB6_9BASI|nr:hypothetical protein PCANC_05568 [Puccinia coronata f. sp. avenae]
MTNWRCFLVDLRTKAERQARVHLWSENPMDRGRRSPNAARTRRAPSGGLGSGWPSTYSTEYRRWTRVDPGGSLGPALDRTQMGRHAATVTESAAHDGTTATAITGPHTLRRTRFHDKLGSHFSTRA